MESRLAVDLWGFFLESDSFQTPNQAANHAFDGLFTLSIIMDGEELTEYVPKISPPSSTPMPNPLITVNPILDCLSYVAAKRNRLFSIKVAYNGVIELSIGNAYALYVFVDGVEVAGRLIIEGEQGKSFVFTGRQLTKETEPVRSLGLPGIFSR
jgi:hypothetical protein